MFDFQHTEEEGDTADLIAVVRLSPMPAGTRRSTIRSIRDLREALSGGVDVPVEEIASVIGTADAALRERLGDRPSQVLSYCKRALRLWANAPRRTLAMRLRDRIPTCDDALEAASQLFAAEKAKRVRAAIEALAKADGTTPSGLTATAVVIEPLLRAATQETFGVGTRKSLDNKSSLVRAAVKLVDPTAVGGRIADLAALSDEWARALTAVEEQLPDHALSSRAILRRLAVRCDRQGVAPWAITPELFAEAMDQERATHACGYDEKLRAAYRAWNAAVEAGALDAPRHEIETVRHRLPDVAWSQVPAGIREPFDALVGATRSPHEVGAWSSFVPEDADPEDVELGLAGLCEDDEGGAGGDVPLLREPETVGNWRAAVRRVWHAASEDPRVPAEPAALEDLFRRDCALALVRAVRSARRQRIEAEGGTWRPEEKGKYETSLLQTLISVGRALRLDDDRLGPIVELAHQIDPAVVGTKITPDGERKLVYADRRIGPRHEDMLRPFGDLRVLGRWLGAPGVIWALAERKSRGREAPTLEAAALARSALVARIAQRVCPLRRTNLARLRISGAERHIHLPVGDGAGWLDLPACEMKNGRAVRVRIDPDTVAMIRRYVDAYRPVLARCVGAHAENEHLFPGAETRRRERGPQGGYAPGMGYLNRMRLTNSFGGHMWRHCRLRLDLHVMRHLAGKVILDQDPSAMRLVQEVLGHKRIETTQSYYAEVSGIVAQARYVELLDRATRQALRTISFRIDLQSQIGG